MGCFGAQAIPCALFILTIAFRRPALPPLAEPLEHVAVKWIRVFTLHPEAAIALANAFGVQGEFG